jgi:CheY-like chemotaxis protein
MNKKILIVDDDVDFIEAVSTLLEANGYSVIAESDGRKGFEQAKQHQPDLMLLDVMMPQSDGFDIARELHDEKTTQEIPVIMVTGIRKAMGPAFKFEPDDVWLPVKAVLEKPLKPDVLLKTVADTLKK